MPVQTQLQYNDLNFFKKCSIYCNIRERALFSGDGTKALVQFSSLDYQHAAATHTRLCYIKSGISIKCIIHLLWLELAGLRTRTKDATPITSGMIKVLILTSVTQFSFSSFTHLLILMLYKVLILYTLEGWNYTKIYRCKIILRTLIFEGRRVEDWFNLIFCKQS